MAKQSKTRKRVAELEAEVARLTAELADERATRPARSTRGGGNRG